MQILSRNRTLVALVCLFAAAFAARPLAAAAQASSGTVLFGRTMNGMVDGVSSPVSSAIFSIDDDGLQERQLTPYTTGEFDMPGIGNYMDLWVTNAFNPAGTYSVLLPAQSALPNYNAMALYGKYVLMNAYGVRTTPMFYGADDLQPPSAGPGYGSVSWGPAGNDQIAYTNVPDDQFGKHPACVSLMNSNGSNNHTLWCADRWNYCAVEAIRWSGDGSRLLVYAVHADHNVTPQPEADIYLINTATGAATLIQANVQEPYAGGGVGDISYDGHEVIYAMFKNPNEPGPCNTAINGDYSGVWCAKNMLTGQTVALADPSNVVTLLPNNQALISPDGSHAFVTAATLPSSPQDEEIYAVKTDGSGLRKVTSPCVTVDPTTFLWWLPVRVSPDGTRLLANCHSETTTSSATVVLKDQVNVVNLSDGSARFVTNGTAYDWHAQ
ncbi:hypothetical protein DWU98_04380 [Dyella monticola]|uniref:YncE family protein n=1 Tax=Dyella monticola TaxID=1927958 RepID=A0A370X5M3_9GAMM|nr:hypothetical protein [Dyella monticola]RDS83580.1 hypothetical protein DWU98_04380 [Dyella monticola]